MHSSLLSTYLDNIKQASKIGRVLDLACGQGRNGLYLVENDIAVTFADINQVALSDITQQLNVSANLTGTKNIAFWHKDFEQEQQGIFEGKHFGAVIVFRYLHRPLFKQLKEAILPNGIIVYETFTIDQRKYGRPKRDDFLLQSGELNKIFAEWKILHSFEGVVEKVDGSGQHAIAQIIAQKPSS